MLDLENFNEAFHQKSLAGDKNMGLISCTESLGSESSGEISAFDDLGSHGNREKDHLLPSSSFCSNSSSCWLQRRTERKKFPPLLTSLNENGRRNFVLKSVRKEGRLEIVGVTVERSEILCASRKNGRLRLHLVKSFPLNQDYDCDYDDNNDCDCDYEEEEEETELLETGEKEEEEETEENRGKTEFLETGEKEEDEETGEEREWKIPATGVRRCYQREVHVWSQQQHRCVPTM